MIVMQIMKVLPAGAHFKILDDNRPVLEGSIAMADKSVMFKDINDDLKYQKIFGKFHVTLIDKENDIWIINIR